MQGGAVQGGKAAHRPDGVEKIGGIWYYRGMRKKLKTAFAAILALLLLASLFACGQVPTNHGQPVSGSPDQGQPASDQEGAAPTAAVAASETPVTEAAVTEAPSEEPTPEEPSDTEPTETEAPTPEPTEPPRFFEAHFLDVGEADAALVICDGHAMMIDGGNADDSSFIYSYLKTRGIDVLDYVVGTHSDEDHVGGLAGALNYARAGEALCSVTEGETRAFRSFKTYVEAQGLTLRVPQAGERFMLGSAEVTVLGPIEPADQPNNMSIVLRIVYGQTSFLFTGDMEREEERSLLDSGCELHSTVLKVAHHGSNSSTSYPFLREAAPDYAVISVGENTYGHPTEPLLSRLRDAGPAVLRTDLQGTIVFTSDGKSVSFTVERAPEADTLAAAEPSVTAPPRNSGDGEEGQAGEGEEADYVLNIRSHIFHYPSCSSIGTIKAENRQDVHTTRDELIAQGNRPCGNCHP